MGVFDLGGENSGGYNIKTGPGSMIEVMKFDMGGAAAAFGPAKAIASTKASRHGGRNCSRGHYCPSMILCEMTSS